MPSPEIIGRYQIVTIWPKVGVDEYNQVKVGAPYETYCRFVEKQSEGLTPQGDTIALDATASQLTVDIPMESLLYPHPLMDWVGTGSGIVSNQLLQVKTISKTPDVKGRIVARSVGLMRFKDSISG